MLLVEENVFIAIPTAVTSNPVIANVSFALSITLVAVTITFCAFSGKESKASLTRFLPVFITVSVIAFEAQAIVVTVFNALTVFEVDDLLVTIDLIVCLVLIHVSFIAS